MLRSRLLALLSAAGMIAGCGDSTPSSPSRDLAASTFAGADPALVAGAIADTAQRQPVRTSSVRGTPAGQPATTARLARCTAQPAGAASAVIGPSGGIIAIQDNALIIPPGALRRPVQITASVLEGEVPAIRFAPHGLTFERPAGLVLGTSGCDFGAAPPMIVYADDAGTILEELPSFHSNAWKAVAAPIRHFSIYAIAF